MPLFVVTARTISQNYWKTNPKFRIQHNIQFSRPAGGTHANVSTPTQPSFVKLALWLQLSPREKVIFEIFRILLRLYFPPFSRWRPEFWVRSAHKFAAVPIISVCPFPYFESVKNLEKTMFVDCSIGTSFTNNILRALPHQDAGEKQVFDANFR